MNDKYLDVMEQYEGETLEVRRGRGAWIFERSDGVKLLKEYRGSIKRLEFEETVLKGLKAQGIRSVDQYVRNRQGELVTSGEDGTKYVLSERQPGNSYGSYLDCQAASGVSEDCLAE